MSGLFCVQGWINKKANLKMLANVDGYDMVSC